MDKGKWFCPDCEGRGFRYNHGVDQAGRIIVTHGYSKCQSCEGTGFTKKEATINGKD